LQKWPDCVESWGNHGVNEFLLKLTAGKTRGFPGSCTNIWQSNDDNRSAFSIALSLQTELFNKHLGKS
jgi:hypothetical protein